MSSDWQIETAGIIREALRREPEIVAPKLGDVVRTKLGDADAEDYGTLAALLQYIGDNEMLAEIIQTARASSDNEIRQVGENLHENNSTKKNTPTER